MRLRRIYRAAPLLIGSVFHEALGEWWRSRRASMKRIAASHAAAAMNEVETNQEFYDQDEYDKLRAVAATLEGMLVGYARTYKEEHNERRIPKEHVEAVFTVEIAPGIQLDGKVDLILPATPTTMLVVEHKTASSIRASYIERLPLDSQVQAYILGAKFGLGHKVTRVLYDVVRKCRLRRKANETADEFNERIALDYQARPAFYFFREKLKCQPIDSDNFKRNVVRTHREFCCLLQNPVEYPEEWVPTDTMCDEFFRSCPYLPLCLVGLDKGTARMYRQSDVMHEELFEDE